MLLDGVDADVAVSADVRVEDPGQESNLRRVEGVGERDLEVEVKNSALVGAADRARDGGLPVVVRGVQWLSLDAWQQKIFASIFWSERIHSKTNLEVKIFQGRWL